MVITKSERNFLIIALFLFTSACLPGRCEEGDDDSNESNDGEGGTDTACQPSQADICFSDVNENLLCHVLSPKGRNCTGRDAKDFCASVDDALNCTRDIIDTSCSAAEGRMTFDNWLAGLEGSYTRLCRQKDYVLLDTLLTSNSCWNFRTFLRCVENRANLTHISDLLITGLDQHECNLLQMSVSICNEKAEKGRVKCRGKANAVNEAVAAFFSSSVCAGNVPSICTVLKPQEMKADVEPGPSPSSSSSSSPGLAIILTLSVTIVLIGLITFILAKRNVITFNTRFKMRRGGDDDDGVEENREDYGRFL